MYNVKFLPYPSSLLSLVALIDLELDEFNSITTVIHEELREGGGDKETIITSTRIEEAWTSVVTHAWHWKLVLHVASSQQREQYTAKKGLMNSLLFINFLPEQGK